MTALLCCRSPIVITITFSEAFERALALLANDPGFRSIEIVATRMQRVGRTTALCVVVDSPAGADLALCERVAARINAALDDRPEPYTLEVESPGLDRPLVRRTDYERFAGKAVCVQTTLPIDGAKTHRGTLRALRDNVVVLATTRGELPVPLEMVKAAHLDVDIRADLAREKRERRRA